MKKLAISLGFLLISLVLVGCSGDNAEEPEAMAEATASAPTVAPTAVLETEEGTVEEATAVPPTPTPSTGGNADVLFVSATETAVGLWTFSVQVAHPDTGWKDYADGWDVVLPDDTVAKANPDDPFTRLLLHPHETEQPFTRSQSNIPIPAEITTVTVRAHDLVDGFGGQEVMVDLTAVSGNNFEVTRLNQ